MPGIGLVRDLKNELDLSQRIHSLERKKDTCRAVNAMRKQWCFLEEQMLSAEAMHRVCVRTSQSRSADMGVSE